MREKEDRRILFRIPTTTKQVRSHGHREPSKNLLVVSRAYRWRLSRRNIFLLKHSSHAPFLSVVDAAISPNAPAPLRRRIKLTLTLTFSLTLSHPFFFSLSFSMFLFFYFYFIFLCQKIFFSNFFTNRVRVLSILPARRNCRDRSTVLRRSAPSHECFRAKSS